MTRTRGILLKEGSDEWLALDWLLTQIGSWTNARWDQHLRHRFGDVRADEIIEAFGYKKSLAGEAPVARAKGVAPCPSEPKVIAAAANSLWCSLTEAGINFSGVGVLSTKDDIVVYVKRITKKSRIPDHWCGYRVVTQRLTAIKPAKT